MTKLINSRRKQKNYNFRINMKYRKLGKPVPRRNALVVSQSVIRVPNGWKSIVLAKPTSTGSAFNIYAYTDNYFFNIVPLSSIDSLRVESQTGLYIVRHKSCSYFYFAFLKALRDLMLKFHRPFFTKIKFKGKGYYMYKNVRNTIAPQFGYAHRVYIYAPATVVRFLSKTKILLFGLSKLDALAVAHNLCRVRPINIFTGRGVRFARQVIYKKTGKVSAYR